jgi:hypothetical protein
MSENVIQTSFAAGELSPSLFARVDFAKYHSGAAKMRNFFVDYRSGASTRPGTEFIRPAGGKKVRLIRFQQSTTVSYALEFGNNYLRFISQGGSVVLGAVGIFTVHFGSQTGINAPGFTFIPGQLLFISGVNSVPQMNNRYYLVDNIAGSTAEIKDSLTNESIDSSTWPPYGGDAVLQVVYTIATPYSADELSMLKFSQKVNKMNLTHPNHPPYVLTLIDATNWTLVPATIGTSIGPPTIASAVSSGTGSVAYKYTVTSVDANGQESGPSGVFVIPNGIDLRLITGGATAVTGSNQIVWNPSPGAAFYNIYGSSPSYQALNADVGGVGFIGSVDASVTQFVDSNIAPDFARSPPISEDPFANPPVNPQVSSYFQQRLAYANGGGNLVQEFWMSKTGTDYNFDISNPVQADDAITGELVSLEVNEIKSMVPMPTGLIMLTTKGAWLVSGGSGGVASQGGPITPTSVTATSQAYIGANDVPPILVNYDILYVQVKGSIVRDLTYNIYANIYTGNDISILSNHLFYGHQILEWAYAEEPFKVIWAVREDGILLSLTLLKEQDMYGWAQHDTLGNFMSVASITEGQFDATYVAVSRPLFGQTDPVTTIERLDNRMFPFGAEDAWCVDCGVQNVPNAPLTTLVVVRNPDPTTVSLATTDPYFYNGQVGWVIRVGGGIIKTTSFDIASRTMQGKVIQPIADTVPDDFQGRYKPAPPSTWTIDQPFNQVFGLDHLEGQLVSVLADGGVVRGEVVHNGSISLPAPATRAIVGLGFQAQLQTMPLDVGQEVNTIQGKRKKVGALTVRVKESRGLKAGRTFSTLTPIKELNRVTLMGLPVALITADERIVMDPLWDVPGQICLQIDDPLPATVLGVIPEVVIGDSAK